MPDPPPIPIVAHGFGWAAAGAWASFLALLGLVVRQFGPWRKIQIDGEAALRLDYFKTLAEQAARIKLLEDSRESDRDHCDERIAKLEAHMDHERTQHETEMRLLRHALNNERQVIDAILMLAKAAPEKLIENIGLITDMRAQQANAMAVEKGLAMSPSPAPVAVKAADDVAGAALDKAYEITRDAK
jgi:hypothetical protein